MLLAPPKKNIDRSIFEKHEAGAFTAFPLPDESHGGLLKSSSKSHSRSPTDLEVPAIWKEGAVRQKRLNASGRKLDSDRTFPSDRLRG
jgi:hypothetical protein